MLTSRNLIGLLSATLFGLLIWLIYFKHTPPVAPAWSRALPTFNAWCNASVAALLLLGYGLIKRGKKKAHMITMLGATLLSAVFLASYVVYHHYHGDTRFLGQGGIRIVYFFILISHIGCSLVQVPLILGTLYLAFKGDWTGHKKLARWTLPVWLYVSVTGVLVFLF